MQGAGAADFSIRSLQGGRVSVAVRAEGAFRIAVRDLKGSLRCSRNGEGAGEIGPGSIGSPGVYLMTLQQGRAASTRAFVVR